VVGFQGEAVRAALSELVDGFVEQTEQRGTGHAVLQAASKIGSGRSGTLLILNGDLPTLRFVTMRSLVALHRRSGAALTLTTADVPDPGGYGRVIRNRAGHVDRIVEERDATVAERKVREINCGVYCADPGKLFAALKKIRPDNSQKEYYLTDAVRVLLSQGEKVAALRHSDAAEVLGVNTRAELAAASLTLHRRTARRLMDSGVSLLDPERTWIDPLARIGRDTVIYPDVIIEGASKIGEDCMIRPGCRLTSVTIGKGVEIRDHSVLHDATIGEGCSVGPFAHLRPGSVLENDVRIGNFVEVKKSRLAAGVKASHLSYLGDAQIGEGSNIGAGTITCNYDGENKHPTSLGKGVFVGSDTQFVAPITVGDGAYIGAGSTVTEDVPAGALALSRARQLNLEGWVERRNKGVAKKRRAGGR
jgi:bifunctional UDP-N-acetylglucosamine pyrophosphorylase/glucosamine-1-phosphate N-acetyltransferase